MTTPTNVNQLAQPRSVSSNWNFVSTKYRVTASRQQLWLDESAAVHLVEIKFSIHEELTVTDDDIGLTRYRIAWIWISIDSTQWRNGVITAEKGKTHLIVNASKNLSNQWNFYIF